MPADQIDEALDIWTGLCGSMAEVEALLQAAVDAAGSRPLTLVLAVPPELQSEEAASALARARDAADTLVFVVADDDRARWGDRASDLVALARVNCRACVFLESDPGRAVVASMQRLREGHAFCVLWPSAWGQAALRAAVAAGIRWRGAWDDADGAECFAVPRGPDGAVAAPVNFDPDPGDNVQ